MEKKALPIDTLLNKLNLSKKKIDELIKQLPVVQAYKPVSSNPLDENPEREDYLEARYFKIIYDLEDFQPELLIDKIALLYPNTQKVKIEQNIRLLNFLMFHFSDILDLTLSSLRLDMGILTHTGKSFEIVQFPLDTRSSSLDKMAFLYFVFTLDNKLYLSGSFEDSLVSTFVNNFVDFSTAFVYDLRLYLLVWLQMLVAERRVRNTLEITKLINPKEKKSVVGIGLRLLDIEQSEEASDLVRLLVWENKLKHFILNTFPVLNFYSVDYTVLTYSSIMESSKIVQDFRSFRKPLLQEEEKLRDEEAMPEGLLYIVNTQDLEDLAILKDKHLTLSDLTIEIETSSIKTIKQILKQKSSLIIRSNSLNLVLIGCCSNTESNQSKSILLEEVSLISNTIKIILDLKKAPSFSVKLRACQVAKTEKDITLSLLPVVDNPEVLDSAFDELYKSLKDLIKIFKLIKKRDKRLVFMAEESKTESLFYVINLITALRYYTIKEKSFYIDLILEGKAFELDCSKFLFFNCSYYKRKDAKATLLSYLKLLGDSSYRKIFEKEFDFLLLYDDIVINDCKMEIVDETLLRRFVRSKAIVNRMSEAFFHIVFYIDFSFISKEYISALNSLCSRFKEYCIFTVVIHLGSIALELSSDKTPLELLLDTTKQTELILIGNIESKSYEVRLKGVDLDVYMIDYTEFKYDPNVLEDSLSGVLSNEHNTDKLKEASKTLNLFLLVLKESSPVLKLLEQRITEGEMAVSFIYHDIEGLKAVQIRNEHIMVKHSPEVLYDRSLIHKMHKRLIYKTDSMLQEYSISFNRPIIPSFFEIFSFVFFSNDSDKSTLSDFLKTFVEQMNHDNTLLCFFTLRNFLKYRHYFNFLHVVYNTKPIDCIYIVDFNIEESSLSKETSTAILQASAISRKIYMYNITEDLPYDLAVKLSPFSYSNLFSILNNLKLKYLRVNYKNSIAAKVDHLDKFNSGLVEGLLDDLRDASLPCKAKEIVLSFLPRVRFVFLESKAEESLSEMYFKLVSNEFRDTSEKAKEKCLVF